MNTRLKVVPPDSSGGISISDKLRALETRIRSGDADAVRARWESGRELLALRTSKKLPDGLLAELGIEDTEAWRRMRFAEVCPNEEAFTRFSRDRTWSSIYKSFPRKNPGKAKSKSKTEPKNVEPTKKDIADAVVIMKKLNQPGVRAILKTQVAEDAMSRRARQLVERQEREEAQREKEEEQWRQQVAVAARQQLVTGEITWENISAQTESYDDTLKRVEEYLDSMVVPSRVRMKVLERQLRSVQARLFRITQRMFPDYQGEPVADIGGKTGIIVVDSPAR